MINLSNSTELLASLQTSGYFVIFILMFFEGPVVTFVASFLASLGLFNIYVILLLSLLGNVIPDNIIFLLGKYGRTKTIERISEYFGLNKLRRKKIEYGFSKHTGKSIILFKIIPGLAVPGLMLAGFSKASYKRFFIASITFNILSTIIFGLLGFYSGITIATLLKYLRLEKYILIVFAIILGIVCLIIQYFKKNYQHNSNKNIV